MKYMFATILLVLSLFFGWAFSAKYLEALILNIFNPESHEHYLDIWFSIFVSIEIIFVFLYMVYIYRAYRTSKHLTKSSSGR